MSFGADRKPDTGDEIVAPPSFFRRHPDFVPRAERLESRPEEPAADRPLDITIGGHLE